MFLRDSLSVFLRDSLSLCQRFAGAEHSLWRVLVQSKHRQCVILSAACVSFYKISKTVNKYQWQSFRMREQPVCWWTSLYKERRTVLLMEEDFSLSLWWKKWSCASLCYSGRKLSISWILQLHLRSELLGMLFHLSGVSVRTPQLLYEQNPLSFNITLQRHFLDVHAVQWQRSDKKKKKKTGQLFPKDLSQSSKSRLFLQVQKCLALKPLSK